MRCISFPSGVMYYCTLFAISILTLLHIYVVLGTPYALFCIKLRLPVLESPYSYCKYWIRTRTGLESWLAPREKYAIVAQPRPPPHARQRHHHAVTSALPRPSLSRCCVHCPRAANILTIAVASSRTNKR